MLEARLGQRRACTQGKYILINNCYCVIQNYCNCHPLHYQLVSFAAAEKTVDLKRVAFHGVVDRIPRYTYKHQPVFR